MDYITAARNTANDFDAFFDSMFGNWGIRNSKIPPVDIYEDKDAFFIEAELPGYREEDVNVNVENHTLHISSEKTPNKDKERKYLVREVNYVKFDRSFTLPETVNEGAIEGKYENGMLTIKLPKKPVEQPKKIMVNIIH